VDTGARYMQYPCSRAVFKDIGAREHVFTANTGVQSDMIRVGCPYSRLVNTGRVYTESIPLY